MLDPIDGTKGFLRGGQFAIALALIHEGVVSFGALCCPALEFEGEQPAIAYANKNKGAFCYRADTNATRLTARSGVVMRDVVVCESVEAGHSSHSWSQRITSELGIEAPPLRLDSQAKYFALAAGMADLYLRLPVRADYQEKVWDHAAGSLIASEAGAIVSDIDGLPLDFTHGRLLSENRGVIVSNPKLHSRALEATRRVEVTHRHPPG